jgi:hypothetical protein
LTAHEERKELVMEPRTRLNAVAARLRPMILALAAFSTVLSSGAEALAGEPAPPACIAIVLPSVRGVEGNATEFGSALRDLLTSFLSGPSLQVMALQARVEAQALQEARQRDCPQVLVASLTRKRGSGLLGRALGQAAQTAAGHIPLGSSAGSVLARGAVAGGAQALGVVTASTRAKDELQLEYRLASLAGPDRIPPSTAKAKACVDGEDVLTPLVERAAGAIVAALVAR